MLRARVRARLLPSALAALLVIPTAAALSGPEAEGWPQWGGARRDFSVRASGLAERWPADGPRTVWSRPVGGGHSCVLVADGRVYANYRHATEPKDVLACVDAEDGRTLWEVSYDAPVKPDMLLDFGPGPNSTPALAGDRIFTVTAAGVLTAHDRGDGRSLWTRDLAADYKASHNGRGYSGSPLVHGDVVIVNCGGPENGLVALDQSSGELRWKTEPFGGGHASLGLVQIAEQEQLLLCFGVNRVGVDPKDGRVLWKAQVPQQSAAIISSPLFIPPDRVLYSAAYGGGTHLFRVTRTDAGFAATELWHDRAMKVHHGNILQMDDRHVVASSGDFGPAFLICLDLETGDVKWRERGFEKANLLLADGKLLVLDQTGRLVLAKADPAGFTILSDCKPLQERAWSAPTLVGQRLYLRDYFTLKCLDLSKEANPS